MLSISAHFLSSNQDKNFIMNLRNPILSLEMRLVLLGRRPRNSRECRSKTGKCCTIFGWICKLYFENRGKSHLSLPIVWSGLNRALKWRKFVKIRGHVVQFPGNFCCWRSTLKKETMLLNKNPLTDLPDLFLTTGARGHLDWELVALALFCIPIGILLDVTAMRFSKINLSCNKKRLPTFLFFGVPFCLKPCFSHEKIRWGKTKLIDKFKPTCTHWVNKLLPAYHWAEAFIFVVIVGLKPMR